MEHLIAPESTLIQSASNKSEGRIIALIPAFDEDRFIGSVVIKTRQYVDQVVVIDDGSQDDTVRVAEMAGAHVIRQPHNQGKAAALNVGLAYVREYAREHNITACILIDGDGQQNPYDIPALLTPIRAGEADVVVGSRFLGVKSNTPGWRVIGQQALTTATNIASGVSLTDSQSGFRALSSRAIEALIFRTRGFSLESEMQFLIQQHALRAVEVPIAMNYDEKPKRNPVGHGLQVLNGILKMVAQHRPLFFFGVPGGLVLLFGVWLGSEVSRSYSVYNQLAIGTAMIAITLIILGALTIFTGIILHTIRAYMTD